MKSSNHKPSAKQPFLKLCPFCGNNGVRFVASQELCECEDEKTEGWFAICDASKEGCGSSSGWYKTRRGAANCWNKRHDAAGDDDGKA